MYSDVAVFQGLAYLFGAGIVGTFVYIAVRGIKNRKKK